MKLRVLFFASIIASLALTSCSDKEEIFETELLTDYMPLQPGKYITYRVDSLVQTAFQLGLTTRSYQIKHVVDSEITDNQGRPSYRVYRYSRNADGSGEWNANGSYFVTILNDQVEVIEDNLRVIKLHAPFREGFTWKGNRYLSNDPYDFFGYNFSNDDDMRNWDFYYDIFEPVFSFNGNDYNDVYTVEQQDDFSNVPIVDDESYGYTSRSVERYAKGIGLVYREHTLWEYQPNLSGADPYYTGFGVVQWMIDHN